MTNPMTRRIAVLGFALLTACASTNKDADGRTPEQIAFCEDHPSDSHCRPRYPTSPRQAPSTGEQTQRTIDQAQQSAIRRTLGELQNAATRQLGCMLGTRRC